MKDAKKSADTAAVRRPGKRVIIISVCVLVAIAVGLVAGILALTGSGDESFDYMTEDLSEYISVSEDDYKGYTLTVKLGDVDERAVSERIMQILYEHKSSEAKNPGKDYPITEGDLVELWYRGYMVDEGGKESELSGFSNMTSEDPYKLGVGSASFPVGVESGLVGVIISEYASLKEVKRSAGDVIAEGDVLYLSYSVLSAENGQQTKSYVRIDLSRDDIDGIYGEGFKSALVGKEIPENKSLGSFTSTTASGKNVYQNVTVNLAYPSDANCLTLEARLPYDYDDFDMAGSVVYFDIFPEYFTAYDVPAPDDSFIKDTLKLTDEDLADYSGDTAEEKYREYIRAELNLEREEKLFAIKEDAMWYRYNEVASVISYPEAAVKDIYDGYYEEILLLYNQYKDSYANIDEVAWIVLGLSEGTDWRAVLTESAKGVVKEKLLFYYIIKKENLIPSDDKYAVLYENIVDEYTVYYLDGKTEADYDTKEEYDEAYASARDYIVGYYGESFFKEQVYYEYAVPFLLEFANLEVLN